MKVRDLRALLASYDDDQDVAIEYEGGPVVPIGEVVVRALSPPSCVSARYWYNEGDPRTRDVVVLVTED